MWYYRLPVHKFYGKEYSYRNWRRCIEVDNDKGIGHASRIIKMYKKAQIKFFPEIP